MNLRPDKTLVLPIVVFGILYLLIALVNHYAFRTYALDLGAYTNALYDYYHFKWNDSTVFKEVGENLLADHFDLYLPIFSPFALVFGTYTLLIVQIVFVLIGGVGVFRYLKLTNTSNFVACASAIYFWSFFGIFAAISFDYHSNVIAATLVPWFFYLLKKRQLIRTFLLLLFIIISKENISLWMAFICLGLAIEYRHDTRIRRLLIFGSVFCLIYFVTIVSLVMPSISNTGIYSHFHYSSLGHNYYAAFVDLIRHPYESIRLLFVNHTDNLINNYVKAELHLILFFSGLPSLLLKPQYILMILPVYFQKLYHDDPYIWGILGQYNIEFAPILAIGIFVVLAEFRTEKLRKILVLAVLVMTIASTFRTMDNTLLFSDKSQIRFYQKRHYVKEYDIGKVHMLLSKVPDHVAVSAMSPFVPHLALRDKVYQFPIIKDAEYIIYSMKEGKYPLSEEAFASLISDVETSGQWRIEQKDEDLTILRKASK
ncbi:MAG: DUF2079 domain-containing protein [Saprospiraceae bacterium]|nr:DUF2079 domain-containing protein [Saprospiraceae bacterium]